MGSKSAYSQKTALEARVIILPVQGQLVGRYRRPQEGPWEEIRDTAQLLAPESQPSRNQVSETVGNTSCATTTLKFFEVVQLVLKFTNYSYSLQLIDFSQIS